MTTQDILKKTMAGLLIATGLLHLVVAFRGAGDMTLGLAIFGVIYSLLGIFLFPGKETAVRVAMLLTGLGLSLGGVTYLNHGGPASLPLMFAIDVVVLALGGAWLLKNKPAA